MTMIARLFATAALLTLPAESIAQTVSPSTDGKVQERAFDAQISSADQLAWLKDMSSAPNHVGSPHNRANAEMQLALFKEWGWDARIETFDILYPTPISDDAGAGRARTHLQAQASRSRLMRRATRTSDPDLRGTCCRPTWPTRETGTSPHDRGLRQLRHARRLRGSWPRAGCQTCKGKVVHRPLRPAAGGG